MNDGRETLIYSFALVAGAILVGVLALLVAVLLFSYKHSFVKGWHVTLFLIFWFVFAKIVLVVFCITNFQSPNHLWIFVINIFSKSVFIFISDAMRCWIYQALWRMILFVNVKISGNNCVPHNFVIAFDAHLYITDVGHILLRVDILLKLVFLINRFVFSAFNHVLFEIDLIV